VDHGAARERDESRQTDPAPRAGGGPVHKFSGQGNLPFDRNLCVKMGPLKLQKRDGGFCGARGRKRPPLREGEYVDEPVTDEYQTVERRPE